MTVTINTPWRSLGDIPLSTWKAVIGQYNPVLAEGTYASAQPHTILALAQMAWESRFGTAGIATTGGHNPLGLRPRGGGDGFATFSSWANAINEWRMRIDDPTYAYANTVTIAEYIHVYAPSSDGNDEAAYCAHIAARANDLLRSVKEAPVPTTNELRIVINPGHRNTTGGNPEETAFTPKLANAYFDAFSAAGFETVNLGDTNGGLDEACRRMAAQIASAPGPCVLFDLHLEGEGAPGVFAIVPDITGLRTNAGVPQDPADTWENNTKDRELADKIVIEIGNATGLTRRGSGVRQFGIMDESQTGVGGDGFRLATFAYTSPYRAKAVRLVVEHGCHTIEPDRSIIFAPGFAEKCAQAAVQAVTAVYGSPSIPVPTPDPLRPAPIWWGRDAIGVQTNGNGDRALAMLAETHTRGKEATLYSVAVALNQYAIGIVKPGTRLTLRGTTKNRAGRRFGFVEVPGAPDQVARIAMSNLVEKWPNL